MGISRSSDFQSACVVAGMDIFWFERLLTDFGPDTRPGSQAVLPNPTTSSMTWQTLASLAPLSVLVFQTGKSGGAAPFLQYRLLSCREHGLDKPSSREDSFGQLCASSSGGTPNVKPADGKQPLGWYLL